MGQFDVDQTKNGFTAPKKAVSGRFASCKSEGEEHFWHLRVSQKTVYNIKKAMTTENKVSTGSLVLVGAIRSEILNFMMP